MNPQTKVAAQNSSELNTSSLTRTHREKLSIKDSKDLMDNTYKVIH